ncbi:hypothetical protein N7536_011327 [Penicillium majusculum]|uniref:D-isomer specific 2-hydroxyacid dehydrogenase NAD-binding domain-containing protein n=1 Tax=Penicillium solitum TaxID=60172 RepID=A0A1V6QYW6_9EURO|nr:uncharacterized protein PENSOL_c027G07647 [Penicillium solitum]KAJ5680188.1 hypothetical protein N7536_011327 [Penicillium majusculum]OQD94267.1 hypothetical protein PENSOL_c027G07647 [Penicillium solitum]
MSKPIVLHLGDDIRWNHDQYSKFKNAFEIRRSYSMSRPEFIRALKERQFGDFFAIYRPFWNTGGEMGNWDEELVSLLPASCKVYASAGAGFDWVDTAALAKKGVTYCNAAAACTESVADAAIWLIISTFRLFSWSHVAARAVDADAFVDANRNLAMVSHNPNGHTLGIIGFGQIGRRTAEKAFLAMNMKIHYHDIVQMPAHLEAVSKATYHKDMDSLLAVSDCVMVATPFSGETLLNASLLAKMKTGSRLINIARGKLLDESALVDALKSGKLAAAGLDVHYDEPRVSPELAAMKNVEMMAHNAGASVDSHIGFERLGMENIVSFYQTGKAVTPVNAHLTPKRSFFLTTTSHLLASYRLNKLLLQASQFIIQSSQACCSIPPRPPTPTTPYFSPTGVCTTANMSEQAGEAPPPPNSTPTTMREAFEVGIINLRASMDRRQAMAEGAIIFDITEFERLSERIWDTRIEFANQIRRWPDPEEAVILANLYRELIGTMPDQEGVVP